MDLGRLDYAAALALQQQVCALRQQEQIGDVLLLVEHPPVLTLGRNAHREHVVAGDELLARRGIALFETNRGGDVTYHGPGQLVGYPILNLRGFTPPLGIVEYLRKLEEVLIRACADYGVLTQRAPGRAGVWTMPGGNVPEKKIAALGVHVARGVTTHGFALNVTTDLERLRADRSLWHSRPRRDQHEAEVDSAPSLEQVANSVSRHFGRVFGRQMVWVEAIEDLLPYAHTVTAGLL